MGMANRAGFMGMQTVQLPGLHNQKNPMCSLRLCLQILIVFNQRPHISLLLGSANYIADPEI